MGARELSFLLLSNFFGGSSYFASAYALTGFSPIQVVFWRTFIGGALFLPFLIRALRRYDFTFDDWVRMGAVGTLGYAAPVLLGTFGQNLSSATNASLLIGVEPVSVVFLAAIFLGEGLTTLKIGSLICSLLGSLLIVLQGIPFFSVSITPHLYGDLLLFLHGFLWSLYSIIGKPVLRKVDPLSFTAITTLLALIPITLVAAPSRFGLSSPAVPRASLAAVAYLALAVTFLGTLLWSKALEAVPASRLANFIFLQPLVGVLSGVFLLKDRFTLWSGCGGALIILGVYCIAKKPAGPACSSSHRTSAAELSAT